MRIFHEGTAMDWSYILADFRELAQALVERVPTYKLADELGHDKNTIKRFQAMVSGHTTLSPH